MTLSIKVVLLLLTTLYQVVMSWWEDQKSPPGQLINIGKSRLHLYTLGEKRPTIILDHSLGGIEGYFLIEELSQLARVCIYDRAGYGWSDPSPYPRHSQQIVQELDALLTQAKIEPPYILIGDSFGSFNVRLYAHLFPEKVVGLVLTDGLHDQEIRQMPIALQGLKLFFISGFVMSIFGAILGIIRLLSVVGVFEWLKPELRRVSPQALAWVKRSFYRPQHWLTMGREIINLSKSAQQVSVAQDLGSLPIVSIKASSFFKPSLWTFLIPLKSANQLREKMHRALSHLSTNYQQIEAPQSGHFVWLDQPHIMVEAVKMLLEQLENPRTDE